jgi:hypothetical protein
MGGYRNFWTSLVPPPKGATVEVLDKAGRVLDHRVVT